MFPVDFLLKAAREHGRAIAVECGARQLSHGELLSAAQALAHGLQHCTGKARPRIAVLSPNSLELFIAIMAVHAGGFVLVPLNPRTSRAEITDLVDVAAPDAILADPELLHLLGAEHAAVLSLRPHPGLRDTAALITEHRGAVPDWTVASPDEMNAIKFTGGSSGRPKGVVQSFRNFNAVVANMLLAFDFRADDRYLVAAPMTHGAGMFMMPVLARGGRCVIVEHASAHDLVETLRARAVTATWVPPTLLYMMLEAAAGAPGFPSLRYLVWGGAPAAVEKLRQARAVFGPVVCAVYGQTEASTIATAIRPEEITADLMLESVGRPTPMTMVAVVNPAGESLPQGELGEIVIRGDLVMRGYLDMPEVTAATIRLGWLHTGDVGYLDDAGYLFVKDRIRDVIISGGFNIYPSDVEAALARHPAVHEAVVFGLADEKWGERVEACIQLRPGQAATAAALLEHARELLGPVKAPKAIHLVADLPRSPVGKVLRREVKQSFGAT